MPRGLSAHRHETKSFPCRKFFSANVPLLHPARLPCIQFRGVSKNAASPRVFMAVDRQAFFELPSLNAARRPAEMRSDLLPGIQALGFARQSRTTSRDCGNSLCCLKNIHPFSTFFSLSLFSPWDWPTFFQKVTGRKIEQSSGTTVPRRFTDEVTLLRTIPAFCGGNRRLGQCSAAELQQLSLLVGIEPTTDVTRTFTTPQT